MKIMKKLTALFLTLVLLAANMPTALAEEGTDPAPTPCAHSYAGGVCTLCGAEEPAPAPCDHSYAGGVCTLCGEAEPVPDCDHSYAEGVCTLCGEEEPVLESAPVKAAAARNSVGAYYSNAFNITVTLMRDGAAVSTHTFAAKDHINATSESTTMYMDAGVVYSLKITYSDPSNSTVGQFEPISNPTFRDVFSGSSYTDRGITSFNSSVSGSGTSGSATVNMRGDMYGRFPLKLSLDGVRADFDGLSRTVTVNLIVRQTVAPESGSENTIAPGSRTLSAGGKYPSDSYTYSWTRDGSSTVLSTSGSLTVNGVAGEVYRCTMTRKDTSSTNGCLGSSGSWTHVFRVADLALTPPSPVSGLVYDGTQQKVFTPGSVAEGFFLVYYPPNYDNWLGLGGYTYDSFWTSNDDLYINAGTYTVGYRVMQGAFPYAEEVYKGSITCSIGKAPTTVTQWPTVAQILVGDTLDSSHLSGGSADREGSFSVTGTKSWDSAGTKSTVLTFTPSNGNFEKVTQTVSVTVKKRTITAVTDPEPITSCGYGTSFESLGLPAQVTVTADGKTCQADVVWSGYDPNTLEPQTLTGELQLGEAYENPDDLTASVTVTLQKLEPTLHLRPDITVAYTGQPIDHELTILATGFASITHTYSGEGYPATQQAPTLPGTYTVTATFISLPEYNDIEPITRQLTITPATLKDVSVSQSEKLTYNGQPHTPKPETSATTVDGTEAVFTFSTAQDGEYGDMPSFTDAGTYEIWYKVTAPNHSDGTGSFQVTIHKQTVTAPTVAGKTYTGMPLTADVQSTELYTVTENEGGTDAGSYDVVLTLTDPDNYKWETTESPVLTLTFPIAPTENAWIRKPSISGWTYGTEPAVPDMGEAAHSTATVRYTGTTNAGATYDSDAAPTEAGDYQAVFTVPASTNYQQLQLEVPFTVKRATLTAEDFSYTEPTDLVYSGAEQSVALTTALSGVTAEHITLSYSAAPKDAGDYTFTAAVAQSPNYEAATLRAEDWKFTVAKAKPQITWEDTLLTYNGEAQGEALVTLVGGETFDGTVYYDYSTGEQPQVGLPTDAGSYYLSASILEQKNYEAASAGTTLTILPKTVAPTVIPVPETFTHDGQPKAPEVKLMDGKTQIPAGEYTLSYGNNVAVGAGNVWVLDAAGGNYVIEENTKGVFLILPDASSLNGLTAENVTAEDEAAIRAVLGQMEGKDVSQASAAAQTQWNGLMDRCQAMLAAIDDAEDALEQLQTAIGALPEKPTTADLETIRDILDTYDEAEGNLTEEQKATVEEDIEKLRDEEALLGELDDTLREILETLDDLKEKDAQEGLDFEDKQTLQELAPALLFPLEDRLSPEQQEQLSGAKEDLSILRSRFAEAEKVEELLEELPATASPDDEDAIAAYEEALEAYEALGDDKKKVDPELVEKLTDLKAALVNYKITRGNGSRWLKGSKNGLTFIVNGHYDNFLQVKIDGAVVAPENYIASSGSTIIILEPEYLQSLKTGRHTITVTYGKTYPGEASGWFRVSTYSDIAATYDDNPVGLWIGLAAGSLLALAAVAWFLLRKKR